MVTILTIIVLVVLLLAAHKLAITRNESNSVLGGVCSGIAASSPNNLSVTLVRVLAVLLALVTHGFATLLYILLWITLPKR